MTNVKLHKIRLAIFRLVEPSRERNGLNYAYDTIMILAIGLSIVPLMTLDYLPIFFIFDIVIISLFIIDYILRWSTADIKLPGRKRWVAFLTYPLTPFAIIDLVSILPAFGLMNRTLMLLRVSRIFRMLRVFRYLNYSAQIQIIIRVFRRERDILISVFGITLSYIFVVALVMFNVENMNIEPGQPLPFATFLDSLYWATVTLTTIGYGDITPVSELGKIVTMISSILGIAIIALPSGIIMAGYMNEIRSTRSKGTYVRSGRISSKYEPSESQEPSKPHDNEQ